MQTTQMTWDDAINDRTIDLQVKWQMTPDGISIQDVIPTRVNPKKDRHMSGGIGVHTVGGRRFLSRFIDSAAVKANIAEKELAWV